METQRWIVLCVWFYRRLILRIDRDNMPFSLTAALSSEYSWLMSTAPHCHLEHCHWDGNFSLSNYLFVCTFPSGELSDLSKIGSENEKQEFLALLSFVCSLPVNVVSIFLGWLNIEHRWRSTDFLFCELLDKKLGLLKIRANQIWSN